MLVVDMREAVDSDFWHLDELSSRVCLLRNNLIEYNKFWSLKCDSVLEYVKGPPWLEPDFGKGAYLKMHNVLAPSYIVG